MENLIGYNFLNYKETAADKLGGGCKNFQDLSKAPLFRVKFFKDPLLSKNKRSPFLDRIFEGLLTKICMFKTKYVQ